MNVNFKTTKQWIVISIAIFGFLSYGHAQTDDDYFGNGNTIGVTVTGSESNSENDPNHTINGELGSA